MGSRTDQMVKALYSHKCFLIKLVEKHKFYQEVYVKNGGKSYFNLNLHNLKFTCKYFMNKAFFAKYHELIEKEINVLIESDIITADEANTLRNMIWQTEDEDNILIGMLLLKKHRKLLDKKLKDPIFESEFITNIACDYYNKIHKPYMDAQLRLIKNKLT